jgi:hypothetical protein
LDVNEVFRAGAKAGLVIFRPSEEWSHFTVVEIQTGNSWRFDEFWQVSEFVANRQ